jgi:hypothetical protein
MSATKKRNRRIFSVSRELVQKSREAALAAVQIFNNPQITFKSEIFIVLMNIAWTYLLHSYYRKEKIEYRYFDNITSKKKFQKTKKGAYKYWELERCLDDKNSPIDKDTTNNLKFLIGVRHEIEHQMTNKIDENFSAKFQACCLNYNDYIKKLFGDNQAIDKHLSFSLQFSAISHEQVNNLQNKSLLPPHIKAFIDSFELNMTEEEYNNIRFSYRVIFIQKLVNHKGQADEVIEFVNADTELGKNVNQKYALIKETERPKFLPKGIVNKMQEEGYKNFTMYAHTKLWQNEKARDTEKRLGIQIERNWYWYEPWVERVRQYCRDNAEQFK